MKSLQDFYVEQGICRTELSERLELPEALLQAEEEAPVPSEAIQQAITVDFGLEENWFTAESAAPICYKDSKPIYDRAQLKGYFFKVSLVWRFLVALVVTAPFVLTGIVGLVDFFVQFHAGTEIAEPFFHNETFIKAELIVSSLMLILPAFSGIFLTKHITKKTGLQGDLKKYKYFYWFLPDIITAPFLTVTTTLMQTQTMQNQLFIQQGITSLVSFCMFFLSALLCAELLDAATTEDTTKRQRALRLFGGFAAAASLLSFSVTCIRFAVFQEDTANALYWIKIVLETLLTVVAAVCIGFAPVKSQKSETVILKVLPIAAMIIDIPFTVLQVLM